MAMANFAEDEPLSQENIMLTETFETEQMESTESSEEPKEVFDATDTPVSPVENIDPNTPDNVENVQEEIISSPLEEEILIPSVQDTNLTLSFYDAELNADILHIIRQLFYKQVYYSFNISKNLELTFPYLVVINNIELPDNAVLYHIITQEDADKQIEQSPVYVGNANEHVYYFENLPYQYDAANHRLSMYVNSFSPFVLAEKVEEIMYQPVVEEEVIPEDVFDEITKEPSSETLTDENQEAKDEIISGSDEMQKEISSKDEESDESASKIAQETKDEISEEKKKDDSEKLSEENGEDVKEEPVKDIKADFSRIDVPISVKKQPTRLLSTQSYTLTFDACDGTFSNNETQNVVSYDVEFVDAIRYSHTANIDDDGNASSVYANNLAINDIVKIADADKLQVEVWYSTESPSYDWLAIYPDGIQPSNSNYSSATISNGKLAGHGSYTSYTKPNDSDSTYHKTYTVNDNTAQFFFRSDSSTAYYGYYAIITGTDENGDMIQEAVAATSSGSYMMPQKEGKVFVGWHFNPDFSDEPFIDIPFGELSGDTTLYAEYKDPDFQMSMIYYDSAVGNGRVALNDSNPCSKEYTSTSSLSGNLTLQVNYEADDLTRDYNPGEFTFKVYGLERFGLQSPSIAGNLFNSTHYAGQYNPETGLVENDYWVFTNKNKIEAGESVEGMVQMVYSIGTSATRCPLDGASGNTYIEYENTEISPLHFDFTLKKYNYNGSISTTTAVQDISRFDNAEDFYWARYNISHNTSGNGLLSAPADDDFYYYIEQPESVELYYYQNVAGSSNPVMHPTFYKLVPDEVVEGVAIYKVSVSQRSNTSSVIFAGYPKTEYTVGQSVLFQVDYYGKYQKKYNAAPKEADVSLLTSKSVNYTLKDFVQPSSGDLLNWIYTAGESYTSLTPAVISNPTKDAVYGSDGSTITIHNPVTMDVVYGWDATTGISSLDGGYELINLDDALLSNKYGPYYVSKIADLNGIPLEENTCDIEFWVRYQGTDEYVLASEIKNGTGYKYYSLGSKKITGYYWKINDLPPGHWQIERQNTLQTATISKEFGTYDETGKVFDAAYLMLYTEDGTCVTTPASAADYPVDLQATGVPEKDLETYGTYMYRKILYHDILPDKYYGKGGIADSIFNKRYTGYTDYVINIQSSIETSNGVEMIYGYDWYVDFPVICNVDEEAIKQTTLYYIKYLTGTGAVPGYGTTTAYTLGSSIPDREAWIHDYINNVSITTENNIDGAGTKRLHFHIDYEDGLNISTLSGKIWSYFIPVRVYDTDILDYGGAVSSLLLHKPVLASGDITYQNGATTQSVSGLQLYNISAEIATGYTNKDTDDVDHDGDVTEIFYRANGKGNLLTAFDAQQELSKLTNTDHNFFKTGATVASTDSEYTYRIRTRTAATGMTNLVLYDSIENYIPENVENWQGTFIGVDLTRSAAQGHIPTIYYSQNTNPGLLGEDSSWLPYSDSIDKSLVKSLAFDYESQVIQPNSIVSVDIVMHTPTEHRDTYAYNQYSATWNRVDPASGYILPGDEHLTSNLTIVSLDTPIADTKSANITKTWTNEPDNFTRRPASITVKMYQNGEEYDTYTITATEGWTKVISGLPAFAEDGTEYFYTIEEVPVPRYTTAVDGYNITNEYQKIATGSYAITANKTLIGRTLVNDAFQFELLNAEKEHIAYARNNANGLITFPAIDYSSEDFDGDSDEKNYVYYVKEVAGSDTDIIYDDTEYPITVHAANIGEEILQISQDTVPEFTNKGTHSLEIQKQVTGNMGNRYQDFHFLLTLTGDEVENSPITYQYGNITGTLILNNGSYAFTLKDGESISFHHIISGIEYTITETDANTNGYTTSVTGIEHQALTEDTVVKYLNTKEAAIPTKARMGNFYIILILISISLFAVFGLILRKYVKNNR